MAFNDNPYIKFKLNDNEYSEVKVDNNIVWRKPLNYTKSLLIMDKTGEEVKKTDAVVFGGMTFSLQYLRSGVWKNCLSPEINNTSQVTGGPIPAVLSNQDVIKYGDDLRIQASLSPGYELSENNSVIHCPSGDQSLNVFSSNSFVITNDFDLDVKVKPTIYKLTVNADSHITSVLIWHFYGKVAINQGISAITEWEPDQDLYYDDYLYLDSVTCEEGYEFDEVPGGHYSGYIHSNDEYVINSKPRKSKAQINVISQSGVDSYTVTRTAGAIARSQGKTDGPISSGDYLYFGDLVTVSTIPNTGYSTTSNYTITIDTAWLDDHSTTPIDISASPVQYNVKVNCSGDTVWNNQSTVTKVTLILRTKGAISRSYWSVSEGAILYEGVLKSSGSNYTTAYYGDTIEAVYTVLSTNNSYPWIVTPQQSGTYNERKVVLGNTTFTMEVKVKEFTLAYSKDAGVDDMTFTRTSSLYKGRTEEQVVNGGILYYGDEITLTEFTARSGYSNLLISGNAPTSTNPYKWSNIINYLNIYGNSTPIEYSLYVKGETSGISNIKITVTQEGVKSGRLNTVIYNGSVKSNNNDKYCGIYYGEHILVEYSVISGYSPINNETYTISQNLTIMAGATSAPVGLYLTHSILDGVITNIKITTIDSGVGPHPSNYVIYDGELKQSGYKYGEVYNNEKVSIDMQTITAYRIPDPFEATAGTVDKYVSISTPVLKTYTLTYSKDSNISSIGVYRTHRYYPVEDPDDVAINSGDKVNFEDTVEVTSAVLNTGYALDESLPIVREYIESNTNIAVTSHIIYGYYRQPSATTIASFTATVTRNNQTITLSTGDIIYYGETLTISATPVNGYRLEYNPTVVFTSNRDGVWWSPGGINAYVNYGTLNVTVDNTSIGGHSIYRTSSPVGGLPTGNLSNGATVAYGDTLYIQTDSNDWYVVGPGYDTEYSETYICPNIGDGDDWDIQLIGTRVIKVNISQRARGDEATSSNSTLDSEDQITLKVRYPDNIDTSVDYDADKLVRVDGVIRIFENEQTFKEELPGIDYIWIQKSDYFKRASKLTQGNVSWWLISVSDLAIFDNVGRLQVFFYVEKTFVKFRIVSDIIRNINPQSTQLAVRVYSKYKTGTTNYTFDLADSSLDGDEEELELYYKDSVTITYAEITGWSFSKTDVDTWSGGSWSTIYELSNGGSFTITSTATNYTCRVRRNIISYDLRFNNLLATYTSIKINDEEKLSENWTNTSASLLASKTFGVQYGSSFSKNSRAIDNNHPMIIIEDTHNNNVNYILAEETTVTYTNSNKFLPPNLVSWRAEASGWTLTIYFEVTNPNNTASYPITLEAYVHTKGNNPQTATQEYTLNSSAFNNFSIQVDSQQLFYTYTYQVTLILKFIGRTVGTIYRDDSETVVKKFDVTVRGWGM